MTDAITDFIDHMRNCGVGPENPEEIIADDTRRRYRVEGDKIKTKNGSYSLRVEPDGFAFGWCMSFKEGQTHAWHSKTTRKMSKEDREAFKARAVLAKRERAAAVAASHDAAKIRAARLWDKCAKAGSSDYLTRKRITGHGVRFMKDVIVVPMRVGPDLVSLQFIGTDGSKRFMKDGQIDGAYFSIAKTSDDLGRIVICEGYATGCSIRQATGYPVIIAFNAGNLGHVAKAMRGKYPDADIIIAADNDQWTTKPDGTPWNPGIEKAQTAASAIGGAFVIAPQVPPDDEARRTDWNDIHCTDGLEHVSGPIMERRLPTDDLPEYDNYEQVYDIPDDKDPIDHIRPLGHNRGTYYFFPRSAGQIVSLSASGMGRIQNLYMLAPRDFWQGHYGGKDVSDSQICAFASAHLMDMCHRVGVFQPESTRGVGAWLEGGKVAVNCGDVVMIDGKPHSPAEFVGEAVYESGPRVMDLSHNPLRNAESVRVRELCRMLNWKRGMHADLLAGWLVIAPIGSALSWRPHIWLTGQSGAGKSTVLDEIVKPILGDVAIRRDGGTTEAGVRKALGSSGRPFILDEAESETQQDRLQMERIIFLARRSSSGGVVENFNASFQARSCFCFSAINPRVEQTADLGRITQLELVQDITKERDARYEKLLSTIHEVITPDFSARLLSRTVNNFEALAANVRTFSLAASSVFGNKRAGDQIGPMLAGAYMLTSTNKISFDDAQDWMRGQDWQWTAQGDQDGDAFKLVTHIMTSRVRYDVQGISRESTIGELVYIASDKNSDHNAAAVSGLRPYGVIVDGEQVIIANQSPQMRRILSDTPWIPWGRTLGDYPGADGTGKPKYFAPGLTSRYTSIPLATIMGPTDDTWSEIPIEEESP